MTNIFFKNSEIKEIVTQSADEEIALSYLYLKDYSTSKFKNVYYSTEFSIGIPIIENTHPYPGKNDVEKNTHILYSNCEIIGSDDNCYIIRHEMYNYSFVNIADFRKNKIEKILKED